MGRLAPPEDYEDQQLVFFYRCGMCTYMPRNWPFMDRYKMCPGCDTRCAQLQGPLHTVMDEKEAHSLESLLRFERFVEEESSEDRIERQLKALKLDRRHLTLKKKFDKVIEGCGFEDWEYEELAQLEARIGRIPSP